MSALSLVAVVFCSFGASFSVFGLMAGTYHTIGSVRYSGCKGKAMAHSFISLYVGLFCAAKI